MSFVASRLSAKAPVVTACVATLCVALHYSAPVNLSDLAYDVRSPWYTSITYAFFHTSGGHLWSNVIVFALAGTMNELIGSSLRALILTCAAIPVSASGQGVYSPDRSVVGLSGVVYAAVLYQLALAVKNFKEMGAERSLCLRFVSHGITRVCLAASLLASEIALSFTQGSGVSYASHVFGSTCGVAVSFAIGVNLVQHENEILLPWIGVAMFAALTCVAFVTGQAACGLLEFACLFPLCMYASRETGAWFGMYGRQAAA